MNITEQTLFDIIRAEFVAQRDENDPSVVAYDHPNDHDYMVLDGDFDIQRLANVIYTWFEHDRKSRERGQWRTTA